MAFLSIPNEEKYNEILKKYNIDPDDCDKLLEVCEKYNEDYYDTYSTEDLLEDENYIAFMKDIISDLRYARESINKGEYGEAIGTISDIIFNFSMDLGEDPW